MIHAALQRWPARFFASILRRSAGIADANHIWILRAPIRPARIRPELTLLERTDQPLAALDAYGKFDRDITSERIFQRINHGLRYFELHADKRLVATTWILGGGTRFMDELGCHIPIPHGAFWVRDIFVAPEMRGQRLLSALIDLLATGPFAGYSSVWSDVSKRNIASLQAHASYGFTEVSQIGSWHLLKSCMIRTIDPDLLRVSDGFKPLRRIFLTGSQFSRYCEQFLA